MHKVLIKRASWLWLWLVLSNLLVLAPTTNAATTINDSLQPYYSPNLPTGASHQRVGIATHPWWLNMHLETFITNFKQLGVGIVRLPFDWKTIEPQQPGQYDWTLTDRLLQRLNDEGFEIVAEFVTIPVWASNNPQECAKSDIECEFNPAYTAQFEKTVETVARRYPFIRHWEFWNEPEQWPNAGRKVEVYGKWLTHFYQAIKKVDPTIQVAATSLAGPNYFTILYNYIEATTGNRIYPWDALAYHPYVLDGEMDGDHPALIAKKQIERLHQLMIERGDSFKPIWISETGFQSNPVNQANMMRESFDWLLSKDYIQVIALHMLHDWSEENYGLMSTVPETYQWKADITPDTKFVPKQPYYDAYKNYPKHPLQTPPATINDGLIFPETGHTVRGIFKRTWLSKGGLALFGYPKTGQFYERNAADERYYLVQYFERVRMEYHPELQGTAYEVQFGLLGNEMMVAQGLLDKQGRPKAAVTIPERPISSPNNLFFPETGHNLSGPFLTAWKQYGGLAIIGYPKSSVYSVPGQSGSQVQYFERTRMELHTTSDGRQIVLFGLLSNQRLTEQGRLDQNYQPVAGNLYNPANVEFVNS
jgi:hypothetical protein